MLNDYYRSFIHKRLDTSDPFATGATKATIGAYQGFLQPVSGSETFEHFKSDQRVTHRLYTDVDAAILAGDYVEQDGIEYVVIYSLQTTGISSVNHHKEILVGRYGNNAS